MIGGYSECSVTESNPVFPIAQKWQVQIANRQTIWRFAGEYWTLELAIEASTLLLGYDPAMVIRIVNNTTYEVEWESSNIQDFQTTLSGHTTIHGGIGIGGLT